MMRKLGEWMFAYHEPSDRPMTPEESITPSGRLRACEAALYSWNGVIAHRCRFRARTVRFSGIRPVYLCGTHANTTPIVPVAGWD